MSSKVSLTAHGFAHGSAHGFAFGFAFAMTAGVVFVSAIVASKPGFAQTAPAGSTTTLQHGSDKEKALKLPEPSFQTREERLNAKPLDWNATIGKPKPRTPTAAERRALQNAKPTSSAGGKPNPGADEEARKLHPDDWK